MASNQDMLRVYLETYHVFPRPCQLMRFSQQEPSLPTLKWVEAREIITNYDPTSITLLNGIKANGNSPTRGGSGITPGPIRTTMTNINEEYVFTPPVGSPIGFHSHPQRRMSPLPPPLQHTQLSLRSVASLSHNRPIGSPLLQRSSSTLSHYVSCSLSPRERDHGSTNNAGTNNEITNNDDANNNTNVDGIDDVELSKSSLKSETPPMAIMDTEAMYLFPHSQASYRRRDAYNKQNGSRSPKPLTPSEIHEFDNFSASSSTIVSSYINDPEWPLDALFNMDHTPGNDISDSIDMNDKLDNDNNDGDRASLCVVSNEEVMENVFKSLQSKLLQIDDFSTHYNKARDRLSERKCKLEKDDRLNLTRTKQKISKCFNEIYEALKEKEVKFLSEMDEMYQSKQNEITKENDAHQSSFDIYRPIHEYISDLSNKLNQYESLKQESQGEPIQTILEMGQEIDRIHEEKCKYFDSVYSEMTDKYENLRNENYLDFVNDDELQLNCINLIHCNVFGQIMANVPKPTIANVSILGNDHIAMVLYDHPDVNKKKSQYRALTYEVLHCYRNDEEKHDKINWENVEVDVEDEDVDIDGNKNNEGTSANTIEFEIDDLNLVNADLVLKVRCLLIKNDITLWSLPSDIYTLTQHDFLRKLSTGFEDIDCGNDMNADLNDDECCDIVNDLDAFENSLKTFQIEKENDQNKKRCSELTDALNFEMFGPLESDDESDNATVCYHEDYETGHDFENSPHFNEDGLSDESGNLSDEFADSNRFSMTSLGLCNGKFEIEMCDIDLVEFAEQLSAETNFETTEERMIENQQLIQTFVRDMSESLKECSELTKNIGIINKQKNLWNDNQFDIANMQRKPRLSLLNHASVPHSRSQSRNNSHNMHNSYNHRRGISSVSLSHAFGGASFGGKNDSFIAATHVPHVQTRSLHLHGALSKQFKKIGHRISNLSGDWQHLSSVNLEMENKENGMFFDEAVYGELFYVLQENTRYLSTLAGLIDSSDSTLFAKTVVCNVFGNGNDSRLERCLLQLMDVVLSNHAKETMNISYFMNCESVAMKMVSAFMNERCDDNASILRMILQRPMKDVLLRFGDDFDLEIEPVKVYKHLLMMDEDDDDDDGGDCDEYAPVYTTMNSSTASDCCSLSSDEAAQNSMVVTVINKRIDRIEEHVLFLLNKLIEGIDLMSFGVRWICKMIHKVIQNEFPNASLHELYGAIGKVIYCNYIEPVLKSPIDYLGFRNKNKNNNNDAFEASASGHSYEASLHGHNDEVDVDGIVSNFEMISRVLRCILCNEDLHHFHGNESLCKWIYAQRNSKCGVFYNKLLDISEFEFNDRMYADKLLRSVKPDITLSSSQVYLIHHLLYEHQAIWNINCSKNGDLLDILDQLDDDAPYDFDEALSLNLDMTILNKTDKFCMPDEFKNDELIHNDESFIYNILFDIKFKDDELTSIRNDIKKVLCNRDILDGNDDGNNLLAQNRYSLKAFLLAIDNWCNDNANHELLEEVITLMDKMSAYRQRHGVQGYNPFILGYSLDIEKIENFAKRLHLKTLIFAKARDQLVDRVGVLKEKVTSYEMAFSQLKLKTMISPKTLKINYKHVCAQGVLVGKNVKLNSFAFHFRHVNCDEFHLEIKNKKCNFTNNKPLKLSLIALLELRDQNMTQFMLESFTFDVDATIELVNGIIADNKTL